MKALGLLGRAVAAARARESRREEPLFVDALAESLAGEEGAALLARLDAVLGVDLSRPDGVARRTRFFDDFAASVAAEGVRQVVLVAAGMDARAFRQPWPPGTRVYELDDPEVLALKQSLLDGAGARPRCERFTVGVDLTKPWDAALVAAGFDVGAASAWLVEGVLVYLDAATVDLLFRTIDGLSAAGSRLCVDVLGARVLEHPDARAMLASLSEWGVPLRFGSDSPSALLGMYGWSAKPVVVGRDGARATSWFVTARRRARAATS